MWLCVAVGVFQVFLCIRVLLLRLSPCALTPVWPVILTELLKIFTVALGRGGLERLPTFEKKPREPLPSTTLLLAALKVVAAAEQLRLPAFALTRWMFFRDFSQDTRPATPSQPPSASAKDATCANVSEADAGEAPFKNSSEKDSNEESAAAAPGPDAENEAPAFEELNSAASPEGGAALEAEGSLGSEDFEPFLETLAHQTSNEGHTPTSASDSKTSPRTLAVSEAVSFKDTTRRIRPKDAKQGQPCSSSRLGPLSASLVCVRWKANSGRRSWWRQRRPCVPTPSEVLTPWLLGEKRGVSLFPPPLLQR